MKNISIEKKLKIEEQRKGMRPTFIHHCYLKHRNNAEQVAYDKAIKKGLEPPKYPIKRATFVGVFYKETNTLAIGKMIVSEGDQFSRPYGVSKGRHKACTTPEIELSVDPETLHKTGKKDMINYIINTYNVAVPVKNENHQITNFVDYDDSQEVEKFNNNRIKV